MEEEDEFAAAIAAVEAAAEAEGGEPPSAMFTAGEQRSGRAGVPLVVEEIEGDLPDELPSGSSDNTSSDTAANSDTTTTTTDDDDDTSLAFDSGLAVSTLRRNRRGCRNADLFHWPAQPLSDMDGPFAVQQFIQQQIRAGRGDPASLVALPESHDASTWQYEHLRQFTAELNLLTVRFEGVCSAASCPQMKATDEWVYLCAAHKSPQECCAIDYIVHTLDGTAALLNSNKWFPSRVSIPPGSLKYFQSIARRLYRIFAHGYYHHKDIYDEFERETHLCQRFVALCKTFNLVPKRLMIIPEH